MIATRAEDIEALHEGGKRLARHLRALSEMVRPGLVVSELETAARERVRAEGDELAFIDYQDRRGERKFPSGLCVSVNDVIVHGPASENHARVADGDVVKLDFGIIHKGLYTDAAVTVIAGNARPDDERLVRGTREAIDAGIRAAKIGGTTGDIGHAVEEVARTYGFGFPRNLSGHGVGRELHEEPRVPNFGAPGTGARLEEGLVIAIEPMMALRSGELMLDADGFSYRTKDGSRTAHIEHTVIIGKAGAEILTQE